MTGKRRQRDPFYQSSLRSVLSNMATRKRKQAGEPEGVPAASKKAKAKELPQFEVVDDTVGFKLAIERCNS